MMAGYAATLAEPNCGFPQKTAAVLNFLRWAVFSFIMVWVLAIVSAGVLPACLLLSSLQGPGKLARVVFGWRTP